MTLRAFELIYANAVAQLGSETELKERLTYYWAQPKSPSELAALADSEALSAMAKSIFQAGFSWRVVEQKWPDIHAAMDAFDPFAVAMWPDERIDRLMSDKRVIRYYAKLLAIRDNAQWILEVAEANGSFGQWLVAQQAAGVSQAEMFWVLKQQGSRLGGMTGPLALRRMGYDCYIVTKDVIRALQREAVLDIDQGNPGNSKKALYSCQQAFDVWHQQSGRSYQDISRILAHTVG